METVYEVKCQVDEGVKKGEERKGAGVEDEEPVQKVGCQLSLGVVA